MSQIQTQRQGRKSLVPIYQIELLLLIDTIFQFQFS